MSNGCTLVFSSKVGYALSRGVQHTMQDSSHEKEQRMKTFAFERCCDRLQLPTATCDFVLHLLLAACMDVSRKYAAHMSAATLASRSSLKAIRLNCGRSTRCRMTER